MRDGRMGWDGIDEKTREEKSNIYLKEASLRASSRA
jgi:hypothetical protein